ncbi:MAG: ribonuclease Y [bacterium]
MLTILSIGIVIALSAGFSVGWFLRQHIGQERLAKATQVADKIIADAKTESEDLRKEKILEAKDEIFRLKQKQDREANSKLQEIQRREKQLTHRELNLDRKVDVLNKKEFELKTRTKELSRREELVNKREHELEKLIKQENEQLERISGLTHEEAKRIQLKNVIEEAKQQAAEDIQDIKENARQTAHREAKNILIQALQRCSIWHVVESTVSVVHLPDDEMKGRIIGREGRNIRSFESATGIEVLIDDTPQSVILSGFDPLRREIAKQSMEKLISDGRIHPGRIEEVVAKTRDEVEQRILEIGEQTLHEVGVHGVHQQLVRLLGKQHYRLHGGQNLLQHSKEVAFVAGEIASQLGLDITIAKRAGLLHEIGQTAEEYSDASPYQIGLELARKFGEGPIVQNAIEMQLASNHVNIISSISIIVDIANSISVSRPGAQKEMLDHYLTRMRTLEEIAKSFTGVMASYAVQAGREVRVIVEHNMVDDSQAQVLADEITKKLEADLDFPGQIKVTVIREFRAIDYAK